MRRFYPLLIVMVSVMFATASISAEPVDLNAAYTSGTPDTHSFWATSIAPAGDVPEKIFNGDDNYANFSYNSGVTNWRMEGGMLKFTLSGSSATLGWGYYPGGNQSIADVQDMWPEQNHVNLRIKGSLTGSKSMTSKMYSNLSSNSVPSSAGSWSGNAWNTVAMNQANNNYYPGSDGFQLVVTGAAGENFEIEWVKLTQARWSGYIRKEFTLPAGTVWRAIADVISGNEHLWYGSNKITSELHINGQKIERMQAGYLYGTTSLDLTPYIQSGQNCVAYRAYRTKYAPPCYFQARIIMTDGSEYLWKTDTSWKSNPTNPAGWNDAGFDDSGWVSAISSYGVTHYQRGESDEVQMAAYCGAIDVRNPDVNKRNLFYEEGIDVAFDVYVPEGLKTPSPDPVLRYYVRNPAADGTNGTLLATVDVTSFTEVDNSLKYSVNLGSGLADGVYTISFELLRSGSVIKSRSREPFTVITNHAPSKIEGTSYTEGLVLGVNMDLEDTIDFTDPADPHPNKEYNISSSGASTEVTTPNIVEIGDRKYRQVTGSERYSFFTYRMELDHQGDFYMAELEYPDDADRLIEVSISHKAEGEWDNSTAAVGAETGRTYYRSYEMKTLRWVFRATHATAYSVDVINGEDNLYSAAANLKIYHITGDLPAIRMGDEREFGIHTERCMYSSGIGNNFGLAKDHPNDGTLMSRLLRDMDWMKETYDHYAQYLKFAGQNMHIIASYQYTSMGTPAMLINHTKSARIPHCFRAFLANVLEINDIDFYIGMEFANFNGESEGLNTNAQVAQGADTSWMVNSSGQQNASLYAVQNIFHPDIKKKYNSYMTAWGKQYKQFTHFKGINALSGPADPPLSVWGPSFVNGGSIGTNYNDPLYFSFDDYTFETFEADTGINLGISPTATNRFSLRKTVLQGNATWRNAFYQWRCDEYVRFHEDAIAALHAERADLQYLNQIMIEDNEFFKDWLNSGATYDDYLNTMAYDFDQLQAVPGLWMGRWTVGFKESWRFGLQYSQSPYVWMNKLDSRIIDAYDTTTTRMVFVRESWDESRVATAGYDADVVNAVLVGGSDWLMGCYRARIEPQAAGYQMREPYISALISGDPAILVSGWTDLAINLSNEQKKRSFSKIYSQLPPEKFSSVLSTGFESNFVIRKLVKAGETWIYVANPGFWPISGNLMLDENSVVLNLNTNAAETLTPAGGNYQLSVNLEPYGLAGYKISSATVGVASYEDSGIPLRERAYLEELLANSQYIMSISTVRNALSTAERAEVDAKLATAATAIANGEFAKVFKLLYEIPVILDVNGVDWKAYGYFDQAEIEVPGVNQLSYIWAPDADVDAGALAWQAEGTELQFNPEESYILGVQVTLETDAAGDWVLQYQEDYDKATPGAWTDVATGNAWEPDTAHEMNLANNDVVWTGWYNMSAPVGYTIAGGEFSNDGVVTDDYLISNYVELWYAIKSDATTLGHSYLFRVIKTGIDFSYQEFPVASFSYPVVQSGFTWAEDEDVDPIAIAWAADNTEILGTVCKTYDLAIQLTLNDATSGNWILQFQEDYDKAAPGPWTSIGVDTIWRPRTHSINISNDDEVETGWYSISAPAGGYTAATGEFSSDADGINDNYASDKYVELWFALYADVNTHGHTYRFRIVNSSTNFSYSQYALINFLSEVTMTFQEGVNGYTGTMDVNLRRWASLALATDPPADVGERAYMRQGPAYGSFYSVGQYTAFLVYFDGVKEALEALPPGTIIQDATLTVYQYSAATSTNAALEVSAVTDPDGDGMWTETTSSYPDGYDHVDTNAAYRKKDVAWTVPHILEALGSPQIQADCGDHGPEVDFSLLRATDGYHQLDVLPIITEWQSTDVYQGFHLTTGLHHFDASNSYISYFISHEGALGTAVNQYVLGGNEQPEWAPKLEITYTIPAVIPGDSNNDGCVNLTDFVLLRNAFGSEPGDPHWDQGCDFDGSGEVNLTDFIILRNHFGECR